MIYEFIATITAGFGMAGLAMIIRQLTKLLGKQAPKWLIPIFAGLGMLGFQIHQEYHWYEQKVKQLPPNFEVIKIIETKAWFRPWSYVSPQISRFMAVDTGSIEDNKNNRALKKVDLYLLEKRMSNKRVVQVIDCEKSQRTDYIIAPDGDSTKTGIPDNPAWYPVAPTDPLLLKVCQ